MIPTKQCYGVIVVLKENFNKFLILERSKTEGDWTFAKGHTEEGETPKETALRELKEETGIAKIELLNTPLIHEEYKVIKKDGRKFLKKNDYFIGFVKNTEVEIEEDEIQSYKWATYKEASSLFIYERRKEVLKKAQEYLKNKF